MPRGRRVNSCGEKSKKLLLEKAVELFSTHGFHQTKISDIVKSANLTQPTFYLYFQSKESLYNDLNEKFQKDLTEIFVNSTVEKTKGQNACEVIQHNIQKIFNYFVENPHLTKIGFYESSQADKVKQLLVSKLEHAITNHFKDYSIVKRVDTNVLAESLVGSMERLTLTNLLTKKTEPQKLAEEISMIYFAEEKSLVRN
jgi:TetR/AcrR family transcriptional regulator